MQDNTADQSVQIPEDFKAFEKWRETGELPTAAAEQENDSEAAADTAATPEHAPESETDEAEQDQEQDEKPGKKGRGFQKRIDQLTAKIRELEAKTAAAQPAAAANETPGNASPQPAAAATSADGEPQSEDFETYKDYVRALTKWEIGQADKAKAAAERTNKVNSEWSGKVETFKAKHADFQEVLAEASIDITPAMQEAIVTDDNGPAIAYHLAKHPEEAKRIAGLSPVATVREIGKLAAKLETPVTPKPQAASKAPKPPSPVAGAAKAAPADVYDDKLAGDYKAWERQRNKDLGRK